MSNANSDSQLVELLRKARDGDDAARDQLFASCRAYVSVIARAQVESWLQQKVDASDLVQQTMLEAHRGFNNFRGQTEAEWLGWLRQILTHNATDFVRHYGMTAKRKVGRELSLRLQKDDESRFLAGEPSDHGETPSQLLMQREREIAVAEAVTQLAEDHQEVIMLRNLQRLPFNEVAERMGRTRPAVQMLWMRAIRRLEAVLTEQQK